MLLVLSPAKSLDYTTPVPESVHIAPELPVFGTHSAQLITLLKKMSALDLMGLMGISEPLAVLNKARYAAWSLTPAPDQGRAAIFAFNGDVYEGLDAMTLTSDELDYVQQHVRILSGLYGVLRPFDLLQAYRLEMGTRLTTPKGIGLYAFWGELIAKNLAEAVSAQSHGTQSNATQSAQRQDTPVVINLASEEYFKSVKLGALPVTVITPVFQDWKNDRYKIISFYAKRARGLMARYCAQHAIMDPQQLKEFDVDGYTYDEHQSTPSQWVYRRRLGSTVDSAA